MRTFKDAEGNEFLLLINYDVIQRVMQKTPVEIHKLVEGGTYENLAKLMDNPLLFIEMLTVALNIERDKVSQFRNALHGDVLTDAMECFRLAFLDFVPSHQREMLQAVMAKTEEMRLAARSELKNLDAHALISGGLDSSLLVSAAASDKSDNSPGGN